MIFSIVTRFQALVANPENGFNDAQKNELMNILDEVDLSYPSSPAGFGGMYKFARELKKYQNNTQRIFDKFENKYLEFGGNEGLLIKLNTEIRDESIPYYNKSKEQLSNVGISVDNLINKGKVAMTKIGYKIRGGK